MDHDTKTKNSQNTFGPILKKFKILGKALKPHCQFHSQGKQMQNIWNAQCYLPNYWYFFKILVCVCKFSKCQRIQALNTHMKNQLKCCCTYFIRSGIPTYSFKQYAIKYITCVKCFLSLSKNKDLELPGNAISLSCSSDPKFTTLNRIITSSVHNKLNAELVCLLQTNSNATISLNVYTIGNRPSLTAVCQIR